VASPPFIGLTGSIAAGKSEALAALGRLGAATLSTDAVAHELLDDPEVRSRLVERWGEEVVGEDGHVDRARVGSVVFGSRDELRWLESVTHPLVGRRVAEWGSSLPEEVSVAVVEVPLLFEAGMEDAFDATICVVAGEGIRSQRARQRGTDLFEERGGRQMTEEEKAARATYVVRNDGRLEELEAALAELYPKLAAIERSGT
jgi:dephospho-CoA kinase